MSREEQEGRMEEPREGRARAPEDGGDGEEGRSATGAGSKPVAKATTRKKTTRKKAAGKATEKKAAGKTPRKKEATASKRMPDARPSEEEIRRRAYQIWQERGGSHGLAEEDWRRAERELGEERRG